MILRQKDIVEQFAPHYAGAIIGAVAAAASAAAAARQQAMQRRAQQNAAQAQKQGMAASATPAPSVADSILGQMNTGNLTRIKDLVQGNTKTVAGATDQGMQQTQPQTPPPDLPMGGGMPDMGGMGGGMGNQMGMQQAVGGQPPDYFQWMQQQQNIGGGF